MKQKREEKKKLCIRQDRIEIVGLDHPPSLFFYATLCMDAKIYRVTIDHGCHWMFGVVAKRVYLHINNVSLFAIISAYIESR